MATLYKLKYTARARSVPQLTLAIAWAGVPLDASALANYGVVLTSDTIAPLGAADVTREIDYTSTGAGPIPDPQLADVFRDYYTQTFAQALVTPIVPDPVVHIP